MSVPALSTITIRRKNKCTNVGSVKFLLVVLQVLRREKQMVNETFTMMMNNKRIITIISKFLAQDNDFPAF